MVLRRRNVLFLGRGVEVALGPALLGLLRSINLDSLDPDGRFLVARILAVDEHL